MDLPKESKSFETKQIIAITKIKNGESATVVEIKCDSRELEKLTVMGLRHGVTVKKVSSSLFHGPIILEFDFMQVALGFDLASKIFVEKIE